MTIALLERQSDAGTSIDHPATSITTASGNFLVLIAMAVGLGNTTSLTLVSPASGATELFNTDETTGDDHSMAVWVWPTTATTYTIEVDPGDADFAYIHALEINNSTGDPLAVVDFALRNQTSTSATVTYDSLTLTEANCLVFAQGWIDYSAGIGAPSGYSLIQTSTLGGTSGWQQILSSKSYAGSGATGDATDAIDSGRIYMTVHIGIGSTGQAGMFLGDIF